MTKYIFKRIGLMFLLLIGMSFIVFASLYLAPGDPATLVAGANATPEDVERMRVWLGLDQPFLVQYGIYLKKLLTLDLGTSFTTRQPIVQELAVRLPNTLNLTCASMLLAVIVGIPIGIITALNKDRFLDNFLNTTSLVCLSIPNFWLGTMLILIFSVKLGWLPSGGMTHYFWSPTGFRQVLLPAFALATATIANFIRIGRSAMLDVLQSDYIRTAKSKGLSQTKTVVVHALRNALIPIITQFGTSFGTLIGGAVVTEQVFVINGIGTYLIIAINQRNYPVAQSAILLIASIFIMVNLLVDIVYCIVDPRIRYD